LVLVEWLDSFGCSSTWQPLAVDDAIAPLVCRSVGWLVHDGAACKVLVPHIAGTAQPFSPNQGCGDMTIPTCAVLRIVDLIEASPP
jgi:hypothetical protein